MDDYAVAERSLGKVVLKVAKILIVRSPVNYVTALRWTRGSNFAHPETVHGQQTVNLVDQQELAVN